MLGLEGVVGAHGSLKKLVVRADGGRRNLLAGQRPNDDGFGVVFERVIDFVVDFVHHLEVEKQRPKGQNDGRKGQQSERYGVEQFHVSMSL